MDNTPPPRSPQKTQDKPRTPEQDDKYAQSLVAMASMEYKMEHKDQPEQKHFISKKMLIYIVASIIISIIGMIISSFVIRDNSSGKSGEDSAKQLLETTKEVRSYEN